MQSERKYATMTLRMGILSLQSPTKPQNPPLSLSRQSREPCGVRHPPRIPPKVELIQIRQKSIPSVVEHAIDALLMMDQ